MNDAVGNAFVVFRIGEEEFALPVAHVNSIIRYEESTPVPRSDPSVLGVINLRGRVIPVVDLQRRFSGTPFRVGPASRIVVAEAAQGPVGIAVDAANEVVQFTDEDVLPVPERVLSPEVARSFTGIVEREKSLVVLIDLDEAIPRSQFASSHSLSDEEGALDV